MSAYSDGGFKCLLREGYSYENTMIPYVPSVTAIGHTCIFTGSVPAIHGIAGNTLYIIRALTETAPLTPTILRMAFLSLT